MRFWAVKPLRSRAKECRPFLFCENIEKYIKDDIKYDADVLLLYTEGDDAAAVYEKAAQLKSQGLSVRVQTEAGKVRCRQTVKLNGGWDE